MRFFGLVRVPRPPSYCLEPNALAGYLLRRSEMRTPFRCRPSGSPSEAMGNTGSGNPHRPPDGGTIFPERLAVRARPRKTGRRYFALAAFPNAFPVGRRACPAQIRRMQPAPCVCGFIQSRMAAASSVCFSAEKSLPRQAAARGKNAARFLPAVLCRSVRRPSRKQGSDGSGVSAAAYGSRRVYPSCGSVSCFCCAAAFSVLHYERPSVSGAWLCCAPSYVF